MRIFVTVGNMKLSFDRLLRLVDGAVSSLPVEYDGICQLGTSEIRPRGLRPVRFLPRSDFDAEVARADAVICHAGVGAIATSLRAGHRPLVLARLAQGREHVNNHQLEIVRELEARGLVVPILSAEALAVNLRHARRGEPLAASASAEVLELVRATLSGPRTVPGLFSRAFINALAVLAPPIDRMRMK